jgi:hypothetical protein
MPERSAEGIYVFSSIRHFSCLSLSGTIGLLLHTAAICNFTVSSVPTDPSDGWLAPVFKILKK